MRMLPLAFTAMAATEGEGHGKNYFSIGPYRPTAKHQIWQI
jgi:hypothetical protein